MGFILGLLGLAGLYFLLVFVVFPALSPRPDNLGVSANGQLAPCPSSPNCVSTQATDKLHAIEPIAYGDLSTAQAREIILNILNNMERTEIITQRADYIHAEVRSALWRFVDDVEFYFDEDAGMIHFRSASRLGRGDMGVNRRRMEHIRSEFMARRPA
ncbi:MAG: DUF1499 domain-containing protein [Phototrophicales bacterium]|nr:MAG: DUF1499 domain-containing protein [Phototrophicales bacterium]RMG74511.1 MAG: DUF1499 domain-containing protein [Chloroflexota bacterium]